MPLEEEKLVNAIEKALGRAIIESDCNNVIDDNNDSDTRSASTGITVVSGGVTVPDGADVPAGMMATKQYLENLGREDK